LFPLCAHAENASRSYVRRSLAGVKTTTPPTIDGDLSDTAWKTAPKVETFLDQQTGAIATDQTVAYILYDDKYIYVAFACKDSQPDKITARETIRDYRYNNFDGLSEDSVEVFFDCFRGHHFEDLTSFSL